MKTNFFQNIADINAPGIWNIVVQTDDKGGFTVSTHFTVAAIGDAASKQIKPFVSNGTAPDFDEGFFDMLEAPVKQTAGLLHNMDDYLKGLANAKEQSKMVQDSKSKTPKAKADNTAGESGQADVDNAEKRKAYTDLLRRIVELESLCKYDEALEILPAIADYPDREAEITKRKTELERKREQKKNLLF
jgi:PRTRC genetic system protein E